MLGEKIARPVHSIQKRDAFRRSRLNVDRCRDRLPTKVHPLKLLSGKMSLLGVEVPDIFRRRFMRLSGLESHQLLHELDVNERKAHIR